MKPLSTSCRPYVTHCASQRHAFQTKGMNATSDAALGLWLRITRASLMLNALAATLAATLFALGFAPRASEDPLLARRVGAGELAGAIIFVLVAMRLRRDAALIAIPIAFVACQVVASVFELLLVSQTAANVAPLVPEGTFLLVYSIFAVKLSRYEKETSK
jgi:hypothetical protein